MLNNFPLNEQLLDSTKKAKEPHDEKEKPVDASHKIIFLRHA